MTEGVLFWRASLIGRIAAVLNVFVLVALPWVWSQPLLQIRVSLVKLEEVSVVSGLLLAVESRDYLIVFVLLVFAIAMPFLKSVIYLFVWFTRYRAPWLKTIGWTATRLSMSELFILALIVVGIKGVGIGNLNLLPGFQFFFGVILCAVLVSLITEREAARQKRDLHGL